MGWGLPLLQPYNPTWQVVGCAWNPMVPLYTGEGVSLKPYELAYGRAAILSPKDLSAPRLWFLTQLFLSDPHPLLHFLLCQPREQYRWEEKEEKKAVQYCCYCFGDSFTACWSRQQPESSAVCCLPLLNTTQTGKVWFSCCHRRGGDSGDSGGIHLGSIHFLWESRRWYYLLEKSDLQGWFQIIVIGDLPNLSAKATDGGVGWVGVSASLAINKRNHN